MTSRANHNRGDGASERDSLSALRYRLNTRHYVITYYYAAAAAEREKLFLTSFSRVLTRTHARLLLRGSNHFFWQPLGQDQKSRIMLFRNNNVIITSGDFERVCVCYNVYTYTYNVTLRVFGHVL